MALKNRLFGAEPRAAENSDFDVPTTQVRMGITSPEGFDPLTSMSVMEQLRTASNSAPAPSRLSRMAVNAAAWPCAASAEPRASRCESICISVAADECSACWAAVRLSR